MDMLESIKMELDGNDLLLEDFPEVVFPIQCLDGIANRCNGQLYKGERTHIGWTARRSCCRRCPAARPRGAIIKVAGITGRIRGMKYKRADGTVGAAVAGGARRSADRRVGPLALAMRHARKHPGRRRAGPGRPGQEDLRHHALHGDPSRRHGRPASSTATSIRNGTASGRRWSMRSPTNEKLWDQYAEIRAESLRHERRRGGGHRVLSAASRGDGRRSGRSPGPSGSTTTNCRPSSTR